MLARKLMGSDRMARYCTFLHLFAPSLGARRDRAKGKVEISDETTDDGPLTTGQGELWRYLARFGTFCHPPLARAAKRPTGGQQSVIGE